jgi:hypothetical protein
MTRTKVHTAVFAILTSLAKTSEGAAPEGPMFAALMSAGFSLSDFHAVVGLLVASELVTRGHHQVGLTAKGAKLAAELEAALQA